ncbi:MAG: DUF192 domain-containing protein [Holosporales bacterium]|jgi:uncharacterized membrane protein (UPF0127 family)
MLRKKIVIGIVVVLAAGWWLFSAHADGTAQYLPQTPMTIVRGDGSTVVLQVEVAQTDAQRQQGLMFRRDLAPDGGMLFIFPEGYGVPTMWMKNTPLSLDMVFFDKKGIVVDILRGTVPFSEEVLRPRGGAASVLEVPAGAAAAQRITIGDRLQGR